MEKIDLKARLLMGLNIEIEDITIKNYTLGEIFRDVGLMKYLQVTNLATKKASDFISNEHMDEFRNISVFDIFCMTQDMNNLFISMMNFFTGYEWRYIYSDVFQEFYSVNESGKRVHIKRNNLDKILEIIKAMYCLDESKKESERDDIDDEMRELLREFEEEEAKVKAAKGNNMTILTMIDGIASKHNSINLLNIWEYKIYQIMHTYYKLTVIDNENRLMTALYSGTIDGKNIEVEKMHWANEV